MRSHDFKSYAHQDLSREEIINYSRQYNGINMAELIGADEAQFPFVVQEGEVVSICCWEPQSGIVIRRDEDPVRVYATQLYLRGKVYPVFNSLEEAESYAIEHNWPRQNTS